MEEQQNQEHGIELKIEETMRSRLTHFKDQADSLTLESVRRLLEKDLELEKFALDAHKKFIKASLAKLMDSADDCKQNSPTENVEKDDESSKEVPVLPQQEEIKKSPKRPGNEDEEMTEDSPIMGVLKPKPEVSSQVSSVSESMIQKAISKRANHFLENTESLTLAGVRRLLEEDLGLEKNSLDPFKKFISQEIDQVLNPPNEATPSPAVKKKATVSAKSKKGEKVSRREQSDSSGSESEKMENKVKSRKETAPRKKNKTPEEPKNRKRSKESDIGSSRKKQKLIKKKKEEGSDSDNPGSLSEDDGQLQSPVRKPAQREKPASGFGKRVEQLKSIIKSCGLSIAPVIYKKAKEVPDNKREDFIVKELEGILSREGLSKNPSEKEIKDCKKRKDTARELEGIDMSNIISSSRRRSTFSFMAPPEPEVRVKAKKVDKKITEKKENDDKESMEEKEDKSEKETEDAEKEEDKGEGEEDEDEEEEEEEDDEEDDDEAEDNESEEEFNGDDKDESD